MPNSKNIYQNLEHRLNLFFIFSKNPATQKLIPELAIQTIKDSYVFIFGESIIHNSLKLMELMDILLTTEEKKLLYYLESSLRSAKKYEKCTENFDISVLTSIITKLQKYLVKNKA
ncbi:hypothetical protein SAMN02745150_00846 [Brevinema andersonii]|uniref:Uncharacterized protein n=1 Tax=Brevinema andersonii TaxID=34097 RepID=A0A1I1E4X4_BREAD|nr:hypothetical protein [Brevinema andersonii]SFB79913.1 hypothetical protein SAMN02745150_00846 [Brevinema andersonii]